jgi:hypothetical protein
MAILNNKQWTYPITPAGKASMLDLMTEPSHRISGDMTIISFDADPDVVRDYTPEPLEVDGSGRVYLWNYEGWHYTDRMATEFVSEKRLQYCESYFMVPSEFEGERYYYMLYSWVNRDWLAYLGRHLGMPHKVADVQFTHFHEADDEYGGLRPGSRMFITVENLGLVLRAGVEFEREYGLEELPIRIANDYCPRHVGRRMFWDACNSRPLVDDLLAHWGDEMELGPVWGGPAELQFFDAENEEVLPFQPLEVHGGWRFTLRFTHAASPPVVLHSYVS